MLKVSNVSANIEVAIFSVNVYWFGVYVWKPYVVQAVGGELGVLALIRGVDEGRSNY
jgi:hypothetical protein